MGIFLSSCEVSIGLPFFSAAGEITHRASEVLHSFHFPEVPGSTDRNMLSAGRTNIVLFYANVIYRFAYGGECPGDVACCRKPEATMLIPGTGLTVLRIYAISSRSLFLAFFILLVTSVAPVMIIVRGIMTYLGAVHPDTATPLKYQYEATKVSVVTPPPYPITCLIVDDIGARFQRYALHLTYAHADKPFTG